MANTQYHSGLTPSLIFLLVMIPFYECYPDPVGTKGTLLTAVLDYIRDL